MALKTMLKKQKKFKILKKFIIAQNNFFCNFDELKNNPYKNR